MSISAPPESTVNKQAPTAGNPSGMTKDEHRRSTRIAATIYAVILLSFLSVCTIAVITTSSIDRNKQGFRAITVKKPISIFDTTYLKHSKP